MGVWLLIAVSVATADCPALDAQLDLLEGAVTEGRFDDARALLDVDATLACGPPATKDQLARLWVAEGVLHTLLGDATSAGDAYRAADALVGDPWQALYGEQLRGSFDTAVAEPVGGMGELGVGEAASAFDTVLDGATADLPTGARTGLHAVQLVDSGRAVWGKVVYLAPDQRLVLDPANLPEPSAAPVPPPTPVPVPAPEAGKSPVLLIAGVSATALGLGAAAGALTQTRAMRQAPTIEALDAAHDRQVVLGIAGYALVGAGVLGVGLHIAL